MKFIFGQLMRGSVGRLSSIRPSIAGLALCFVIVGCNRGAEQAGGGMGAPLVTVSAATSADVPVYIDEIGRAVASESVTIQPQVTGVLTGRHFVDGANVKKGDLLFEIDPRPFEATLAQAKAALLQNQAALRFAKEDYARVEGLKGTSAMSEEDMDQKKNAADVSDALVQAAEAQVETARLNLEYCKIVSPIDGLTGTRLVDVGNVVNTQGPSGGTQLVIIQKMDPIYADFTIDEAQLSRVQQYMSKGTLSVNVQLPQDVVASSATTQPFQPRVGQLIFLNNVVQDGTGTVKLRAQLPNEDRHFWPGQFVNVRLVLTVSKGAVLIPNEATQVSQQGPYVYVVKSDGTADLRPVVLGQRQGDLVVVESGLEAGEQVIQTGQAMVQPGKPVTVQKPAGGMGSTASVGGESGHS